MLRIRKAHKDALRADALAQFEERLADHLRLFFPALTSPLDDAALFARIREGMQHAAALGMVNERDVAMVVDVLFARGEAFAEETWATAILEDPSLETPTERAEALFDAAFEEPEEEPSP